jgi:hypothetical protein
MTISEATFGKDPSKYLKQAVKMNGVIEVSTENGNAIVLSAEEYTRRQEEFETIIALQKADADIAAGRVIPFEEAFSKLEAKNKEFMDKTKL